MFRSIATVSCLVCATQTAQAECMKWLNQLSHCEVSSVFCSSPAPTPSHNQLQYYNNWRYADKPEAACDQWAQKTADNPNGFVGRNEPTAADPNETYQTLCYLDENNNGKWDDFKFLLIERKDIPRESCCELTPNGPHATVMPDEWYIYNAPHIPLPPAPGLPFTSADYGPLHPDSQRKVLLLRNDLDPSPGLSGDYLSDLYRPPGHLKELEYAACGDGVLGDEGYCQAQIDHIIPRKDVSGCNCGANSFKNALVISAYLNRTMSNDCKDPSRRGILKFHTVEGQTGQPIGVAAPPGELEKPDALASCDPDDAECFATIEAGGGGCNAATGGLGVGLLVMAFARRRRGNKSTRS